MNKLEDIRKAVLENPEKAIVKLQGVHELSIHDILGCHNIQQEVSNWFAMSIAKGLLENDLIQITEENLPNGIVRYEATLLTIDFKIINKEGGEK